MFTLPYLLPIVMVIMVACEDAPIFPQQYTLDFNETAAIGPLKGTTTGTNYVDGKNNRQTMTRANGHHDRYCGSVYKFSDTPCTHRVLNDKRYLDFPDKKYCCFCCDSSHGCGVVKSDWLVKGGAEYQGTTNNTQKWYIKGLQDNYYYNLDNEQKTPVRLYQVSDDDMNFTRYQVGDTFPQGIFDLPSYCTDKCGATTICAALRGDSLQTQ